MSCRLGESLNFDQILRVGLAEEFLGHVNLHFYFALTGINVKFAIFFNHFNLCQFSLRQLPLILELFFELFGRGHVDWFSFHSDDFLRIFLNFFNYFSSASQERNSLFRNSTLLHWSSLRIRLLISLITTPHSLLSINHSFFSLIRLRIKVKLSDGNFSRNWPI